jgi:N-methylhydantoinase A
MPDFRIGVDIGGTFTDIVFLGGDGQVLTRKVASTPDDYSRAVLSGIRVGLEELRIHPGEVTEVGHGFTVATNAIIEEKGAHMALITTEGFRDVLEFRRNRTPRLYDLYYEKSPTLVKRQYRLEVGERLNFRGEVLRPLNTGDVDRAVQAVVDSGVESVAVCLLHSYANPAHEQYVAQVLTERAPGVIQTLSSDLLPEMKEYERTSTTVINSYVRPVVERYLARLTEGLEDMGITVPVAVMQSNGGLATSGIAMERPVYCIESGPAAGVVGAFHLGRRLDMPNLMTLDMGGTTAKASIIENGEMLQAPEYEVGGGISVGHRLLRGSGHILRVPAIDLAEVGAGGGSIASVDRSGSLRVGPQSSGAFPGPACYQLGGQDATVTDADVLLGYLNPQHLLAGDFPINAELARRAIADNVAAPLNLSDVEAAHGIHLLVNSNMGRALRAVSSERGRDPRRFDLICFGGGGPVHAAGLAEMLDINRVVVPPFPGVFSSFGLLVADVEHHFVQTHFKTFEEIDLPTLSELVEGMWEEGRRQLRLEGFDDARHEIITQADMKYEGQVSDLTVAVPSGPVTQATLAAVAENFDQEHEQSFGYLQSPSASGASYQLVNIRVIARGLPDAPRMPDRFQLTNPSVLSLSNDGPTSRPVYFGPNRGWADTPVVSRPSLAGRSEPGPLIIEEYDSTTVVPPTWTASVDDASNIILERE